MLRILFWPVKFVAKRLFGAGWDDLTRLANADAAVASVELVIKEEAARLFD